MPAYVSSSFIIHIIHHPEPSLGPNYGAYTTDTQILHLVSIKSPPPPHPLLFPLTASALNIPPGSSPPLHKVKRRVGVWCSLPMLDTKAQRQRYECVAPNDRHSFAVLSLNPQQPPPPPLNNHHLPSTTTFPQPPPPPTLKWSLPLSHSERQEVTH